MSQSQLSKSQKLETLNKELDDHVIHRKLEMTKEDYEKLLSIKNRLRDLLSENGEWDELDEDGYSDEDYCEYLVQSAYFWLNEMEEYFENKGNKWD